MENIVLINVLAPENFADCHIKGSVNVSYDNLVEYTKNFPKDTEIVVYCASYACLASSYAWTLLKDQGFTKAFAYEGGTAEWYRLGYPTEGPAEMPYLKNEYPQPTHTGEVKTISAQELKRKLSLS